MQDFYAALFVGLALVAALLESLQVSWVRPTGADPRRCCADVGGPEYKRFRNNYVFVYGLMMGAWRGVPCPSIAAGWLAGP